MEKNIDHILSELIEMIPELKNNQDEWKEFIQEFVDARPDAKMDASFKIDLQNEILNKAKQMKSNPKSKKTSNNFIAKMALTLLGGGALATFVIVPMMQTPTDPLVKDPIKTDIMPIVYANGLVNITKNQTTNAFGELKVEKESEGNQGRVSGGEEMAEMAIDAPMMSSKMIMPPQFGRVNYEYLYEGSDLPTIESTIDIYKKLKGTGNGPNFNDQLEKLGINLVDLATFKNLSVETISLKDDVALGYIVSVNFGEGNVSIHQDYEKWSKALCPGEEYCRHEPLNKEDMLSDKELTKIANTFLKDHKIETAHIGKPTIDKYWEENEREGGRVYYPDSVQLVYPFVINGKELTDQWGGKVGVRVSVNLRLKKVENANFSTLNLESSTYESSTVDAILNRAKEGGAQGVKYNNPEKVIKVKLDTPKIQLTQMYLPQENGKRDEIFVPAFVFPVKESDKETKRYYNQKQIIVPIAKDLFATTPSLIEPYMMKGAIVE